MKQYKAIIYDIDGTILNTLKMNMVTLQRIIKEELQEEWPYENVLMYASLPGMKVMEELHIKDKDKVYARWVTYVNEFEEAATLYPGFIDVFDAMKDKMKQAVVSAKTYKQYEIDFISKGLDQYMDVVILAEDTLHHKPDPEPLTLCIEKLGVQKEHVIYIGDAMSDYQCCRRAGVDFGFAKWGSLVNEEHIKPMYVFEEPFDLLQLLDI